MTLRSFFRRLVPSKTSIPVEKEKTNSPKVIPVIKLDLDGIPYRDCQECEGKMYKKGNTWICDLLGNSFDE